MLKNWNQSKPGKVNGEEIVSNTSANVFIEKPYTSDSHPVNGKHAPEDEDDEEGDEDDLILGDEEDFVGDEEEFEVELEEDMDKEDLDEDDLVIDSDDDADEDNEDL